MTSKFQTKAKDSPVSMHVRGTEGKTVVDESRVYENATLCPFKKVIQVTQVTMAPPNPIASTVLIQNKHLTRTKPTLWERIQQKPLGLEMAMTYLSWVGTYTF